MPLGNKKSTKVLERKVPILGNTQFNGWAAVTGFKKEKVKVSCNDIYFSVK